MEYSTTIPAAGTPRADLQFSRDIETRHLCALTAAENVGRLDLAKKLNAAWKRHLKAITSVESDVYCVGRVQ